MGAIAAVPKMDARTESGEGLICVMRLWKADSQRETTADEGGRQKTNNTGTIFPRPSILLCD